MLRGAAHIWTSKKHRLVQLMPTGQQVRLRAAWLRWRPRESSGLGQSRSRSRSISSRPPPPPSKQPDPKSTSPRTPSLLEELFPEEARKESQTATRPKERDIPRLPKPAPGPPVRRARQARPLTDNWWSKAVKPAGTVSAPSVGHDGQQVAGVLMLRNASKTLVEDDFTRLIPQGLHIEGWPLDRADIVKVIPGRDTRTLEREDFYFILFRSREAMNAYRTHVRQLHSLAFRHVQSSLTSPIPPPPGYQINGQDVDALLQSYTLIPPSRNINLLPLPFAVAPSVADVIKNRGYPDIVRAPLEEPYIVMMRLEGVQLPVSFVKGALGRAEKERRIPWNRDFGDLRYHVFEAKAKNVSPLDSRSRLEKEEGWNNREKDEDNNQDYSDIQDIEHDMSEESSRQYEKRKHRPSYLFGFHNHDAALTFVQYWHRKPIHLPGFAYGNDDIPPVAHVELLW